MIDRLAFDTASVRTRDAEGRLHVSLTNISKATVNPYLGREIPGCDTLGLEPDRIYHLLRDPDELAKAAGTFNNIPLLSKHVPVTPAAPMKELVVGSTGTDAVFEAPFLKNSLVVWDAAAIAGIEADKQKELSCAYRYDPDMTPGVYQGIRYDGVMRNIRGNHVALVEQGRAGSDVVVGDSKESLMSKTVLSRKAALAKGALAVYLRPKLAMDAKIDLAYLLKGVTAANWQAKKSTIVADLKARTAGKLAQDADIEDVVQLLDSLDDDGLPDDNNADPVVEAVKAFLQGKISDEDLAKIDAMLKASAEDDADGDGDDEALLKKLRELLDSVKPAQDNPPPTPGTPKPPTPEPGKEKDTVDKAAMDSAIRNARDHAVKETMQRMRDISEAEDLVRPFIGKVAIAQDSAEAVYRLALDAADVDVTGVHPSAFKAMVRLLPKPGDAAPSRRPLAQDSVGDADFAKHFPGASRFRTV
jgi:hypothetical protein